MLYNSIYIKFFKIWWCINSFDDAVRNVVDIFEIIYITYSYNKLYIYVLELLQRLSCQTDDEVREERDLERASSSWASVPRFKATIAAAISWVHSSRSVEATARARKFVACWLSAWLCLLNWPLRRILNPGLWGGGCAGCSLGVRGGWDERTQRLPRASMLLLAPTAGGLDELDELGCITVEAVEEGCIIGVAAALG